MLHVFHTDPNEDCDDTNENGVCDDSEEDYDESDEANATNEDDYDESDEEMAIPQQGDSNFS